MITKPLISILLLALVLFSSCSKSDLDDTLTEGVGEFVDNFLDIALPGIINLTDPKSKEITYGTIPCEDGMAMGFPCSNYDLLSHIPLGYFGSSSGNDNWGWTDPDTGIEYVLSGLDDGIAFVSIEDPENPIYLGKLPTATLPSSWRDVKVHNNHAFVVSEAQNHGMQVFDLTKLRSVTEIQTFSADVHLTDFGNAHNISINSESGYAYVLGSNLYEGGPVFIDVNDPKNPILVGGYEGASYTHDAQIVLYNGPDSNFQGKELLFGSNSDGGANNRIVIVDVTDKANPELVQSFTYSNGGYTHQGYLSEDHRYFFIGDELDELNYGSPTSTRIFDLSELTNPLLHLNYYANVNSIDHNGYVKGNLFFLASYTAGFRVLDISGIDEKQVEEIGFFDTYPADNSTKFNGAWSIYPYFESGVIAINDIDLGLFLVKVSEN
ncbi:choice-of-anchor B family protein [Flavobacteriaceae bacterium]|jgi:choice-of-anchor B domain-containing protein|nr:choice-of-anchor B family protein [Flavobacteriaceae bacterium]